MPARLCEAEIESGDSVQQLIAYKILISMRVTTSCGRLVPGEAELSEDGRTLTLSGTGALPRYVQIQDGGFTRERVEGTNGSRRGVYGRAFSFDAGGC